MPTLDINATLLNGRRALRISDFCKLYSISRATVYKLATDGKLRIHKIGGRSLIRVEDVEAWPRLRCSRRLRDLRHGLDDARLEPG
jgi:excisionase family DNA binding protein